MHKVRFKVSPIKAFHREITVFKRENTYMYVLFIQRHIMGLFLYLNTDKISIGMGWVL